MTSREYVRFFEEFGVGDVPLVGGKNASLGEIYRLLSSEGVRVPNGSAVTAEGLRYTPERAGAGDDLHEARLVEVAATLHPLVKARALERTEALEGELSHPGS